MRIVVCVKRVPDTAEEEVTIARDRRSIEEKDLSFDANESDRYAVEEALRLKEKHGGEVVLVTVGPEEAEEVLRMELAKGADRGIHVVTDDVASLDGHATAAVLAATIGDLGPDIVLAGCIASDNGLAQVGGALAEMLGFPHATLVTSVEVEADARRVRVGRELEGGLVERVEMSLPAVVLVQTGINEPRYASILGIRKAGSKEVKEVELDDLAGEPATTSKTVVERLALPEKGRMAELLPGSPEEASAALAQILKGKGLILHG